MFLSLIPRIERDPYKTHVYLYSYFPNVGKDEPRPFVYRETDDFLIVVSRTAPNCKHIDLKPRIQAGSTLAFSLICSPQRGSGKKVNGKRVTTRIPYFDHKEVADWLERRLEGAARITYRTVHDMPPLKVNSTKKTFSIHRLMIKGALQVDDRAEFIERCTCGIGPKGWLGVGMLLMPEIMRDALELSNAAA